MCIHAICIILDEKLLKRWTARLLFSKDHCKTHLVAGDSGFDRFVLVLEVNCIKQPEPKPYLTTDNPQNICEEVTKTAFQKYDAFVVILSQMFGGYHICKIMVIIACSSIHRGV